MFPETVNITTTPITLEDENMAIDIEAIKESLGPAFECEDRGNWVMIRTPHTTPAGRRIDLYHYETTHGPVLSDLGDTRGHMFRANQEHNWRARHQAARDDCGIESSNARILYCDVEEGDHLPDMVDRMVRGITTMLTVENLTAEG